MTEKVSNTLRAIRTLESEVRQVLSRLGSVETRLGSVETTMATKVDVEQLRARIVESEVRVTTEVVAVAGLVRELSTRFVGSRDLTPRLDDLDRRVTTLEQRKK